MFKGKSAVEINKLTEEMENAKTFDELLCLTEQLKDLLLETYKMPTFGHTCFLIHSYARALSMFMYEYGSGLDDDELKDAMTVYDPYYNDEDVPYDDLPEEAKLYELIPGFVYDFQMNQLWYRDEDSNDDPYNLGEEMCGNIGFNYMLGE